MLGMQSHSSTQRQNLSTAEDSSSRVLVLAPTGRDSALACSVLVSSGIPCQPCSQLIDFCQALRQGAGLGIIAAEALTRSGIHQLHEALQDQPPWSDFPIIIISSAAAQARINNLEEIQMLGNVTLLERPLSV